MPQRRDSRDRNRARKFVRGHLAGQVAGCESGVFDCVIHALDERRNCGSAAPA
jgi:hypothetical protein